MEMTLGRFGDLRLEKGGPIFWPACFRSEHRLFACDGLVATVRGRSA